MCIRDRSILGLFVLGPIFHQVEKVILSLTTTVLYLPFGLGGLIIGGTHQLIVVSGVHHIFNLLEINLLSATGQNPVSYTHLGGNSASQTLALVIQEVAIGQLTWEKDKKYVLNEIWLGLVNGIITGIFAAIALYIPCLLYTS